MIYAHPLSALEIPPHDAVMIDDKAGCCAGAEEAGVRAIHLARDRQSPRSQFQTVLSLHDVIPLL